MMKRIVTTLFFLLIVLFAAALIAPGFINWNRHKDRVVARLETIIQRKIDIAGDVKFKVLPQPQILLENVTISNTAGTKTPYLMHLKQLEARVRLQPLLNGQVDVESVRLVEPQIDLEILDGAKSNWSGILKGPDEAQAGITAESVHLDQVTVSGGSIHYFNHVTGVEQQLSHLNLTMAAETLLGPYAVTGDMQYNNKAVNLTLNTQKYDGTAPVPVTLSLLPAEGLPQVKFDGAVDPGAGFDAAGTLDIAQGTLASLVNDDYVSTLPFMKDIASVTATVDSKGGETHFKDIKAKFGEAGTLTGSIGMEFVQDKKPVVAMDVEGSHLVLSDGGAFPDTPKNFIGSIKFKGKDVTWQGLDLLGVSFSADFDQKEWTVKAARVNLPGKSVVSVAGVVTPRLKYYAFGLEIQTEDLAKLLQAARLKEDNALRILVSAPLVKKMTLSGNLDIKPDKISISDIDATADEKMKVSGVLDIDRKSEKQSFAAKINIDGFDATRLPADAYDAFLKKMLQSDADLELSLGNFVQGGLKIKEIRVTAKTDGKGLALKDVVGALSDDEGFDFHGHVSSLAPLGDFDVAYDAKLQDGAKLAEAFGFPLPPPLGSWQNINAKGKIEGNPENYKFSVDGKVDGGEADIEGSSAAGVYQSAIHLRHPAGGEMTRMMNLPVENLLSAQNGALDIAGMFSGTKEAYKIDNIKSQLGTSALSGMIERKDGTFHTDFTLDKIDLDNWLWNDWTAKDGMALTLHGKTLAWHGLTVENPALQIEAGASSVKISKLTGQLWGGTLDAAVDAEKKDNGWSSSLKGTLENADLDQWRNLLDIKGLMLGKGSLDIDLKSSEPQFFKSLAGISGTLGIKAASLTVKGFNPETAAGVISKVSGPVDNLQQLVNNALEEKGDTVYPAVGSTLKISGGKASFENLKLPGVNHEVTAGVKLDLSSGHYDLEAGIHLKQPDGVPDITLRRSDALSKAGGYAVDISAVEAWLAKKYTQQQVAPALPAAPAKDSVGGILQRLDEKGQ